MRFYFLIILYSLTLLSTGCDSTPNKTNETNSQLTVQNPIDKDLIIADLLTKERKELESVKLRIKLAPKIQDAIIYETNHLAIWHSLDNFSTSENSLALNNGASYELQQWVALKNIVRNNKLSLIEQSNDINKWLNSNSQHPAKLHPIVEVTQILTTSIKNQMTIAVLLPFTGQYSAVANAIQDGFMQSFYQDNKQTKIIFYSVSESDSIIGAHNKAIKEGAKLIVGPLFKNQVQELSKIHTLSVPTIALNRSNSDTKSDNLYEFSLAPEDEIQSIIDLASKEHRHTALIIAQKDEWAQKNLTTFKKEWEKQKHKILASVTLKSILETTSNLETTLNLDKSKNRIEGLQLLIHEKIDSETRKRQDFDMVMLFLKPEEMNILKPILDYNLSNDIPMYSCSTIYRGFPKPEQDKNLDDIKFTDIPILFQENPTLMKNYISNSLIRLYAFGSDAYQLASRLDLMKNNQDQKLYGATGIINISENTFVRKTSFGVFNNGIAKSFEYNKSEK